MKNEGCMKEGCMKGQFFAYDAIVAGALFAILLTVLFVYWDAIRSFVFVQIDDLFRVALRVSDVLMTPGNPQDWNAADVQQIGIAEYYGSARISESKLANLSILVEADYDRLKSMLALGIYDAYITVNSSDKNIGIGIPPAGAKGEVSITKPVVYKNGPANLTVTIWTNSTV